MFCLSLFPTLLRDHPKLSSEALTLPAWPGVICHHVSAGRGCTEYFSRGMPRFFSVPVTCCLPDKAMPHVSGFHYGGALLQDRTPSFYISYCRLIAIKIKCPSSIGLKERKCIFCSSNQTVWVQFRVEDVGDSVPCIVFRDPSCQNGTIFTLLASVQPAGM